MLTKIGLENFKSWRELDIDLAPITILFGTNSSGKTSVLQALLLLKQTVNSFDRKQHINLGGGERDYVDFGSYQDLVFGHELEDKITINLRWQAENEELHGYIVGWEFYNEKIALTHLKFTGQHNRVSTPNYIELSYQQSSDSYVIDLPQNWEIKSPENISIENSYKLPFVETFNTEEKTHLYGFLFSHEFERLIKSLLYLGPLRQSPKRYDIWTGSVPGTIESDGNYTYQTLIASQKDELNIVIDVQNWLVKLGLVDEFRLETDDGRFYQPKIVIGGVESALVDVGFGVSQVLPVITMLLSAPEGSIILLEQPELHLHPNAQMVLADLMLYVAEKRNLQLIVESHSEHLLRRLQRRIAEVEQDFATPDNIKMYFCEPGKDGSTIRPVDVDEYGQIANWPHNFFGDISGDLDAMTTAALNRRRQELTGD